MRILFLSAFYPPYVIGGWEQLVEDINLDLQARGHETHVLTSMYGINRPVQESGVDRILALDADVYHYKPLDFLTHFSRVRNNIRRVKSVIETFQPDIVFIHVMWNLSKGVAWVAEKLFSDRIVYYIANDWPYTIDLHSAFWVNRARRPLLAKAKELIAPVPLRIMQNENRKFQLDFKRVVCVSQSVMKDLAEYASIDPQKMRVIYNGVNADVFTPDWSKKPYGAERAFSLLYAGNIASHKGVHTAIKALALLTQAPKARNIHLSIIGSGHPDYEDQLRNLVSIHHLEDKVSFLGRFPRSEMPALFRRFDVLVFPSIWNEPLARVIEEAMASGLAVIGTLTGGTGELLIDGKTGLTFLSEHPEMMAQRIEQLYDDPVLCKTLAENGRNKVVREFGQLQMMDEIEVYLNEVVTNSIAEGGQII